MIIHDALRAPPAERLDHFRAEPARAAGDEHDFAGEIEWIGHGCPLPFRALSRQTAGEEGAKWAGQ